MLGSGIARESLFCLPDCPFGGVSACGGSVHGFGSLRGAVELDRQDPPTPALSGATSATSTRSVCALKQLLRPTSSYSTGRIPGPVRLQRQIELRIRQTTRGKASRLRLETNRSCTSSECRFTFQPLERSENPRANNMPGVLYRRTLKIRVFTQQGLPAITGISAFSDSVEKPLSVRVGLGYRETKPVQWTGSVEVDNGNLQSARPWGFGAGDRYDNPRKWTLVSRMEVRDCCSTW